MPTPAPRPMRHYVHREIAMAGIRVIEDALCQAAQTAEDAALDYLRDRRHEMNRHDLRVAMLGLQQLADTSRKILRTTVALRRLYEQADAPPRKPATE